MHSGIINNLCPGGVKRLEVVLLKFKGLLPIPPRAALPFRAGPPTVRLLDSAGDQHIKPLEEGTASEGDVFKGRTLTQDFYIDIKH